MLLCKHNKTAVSDLLTFHALLWYSKLNMGKSIRLNMGKSINLNMGKSICFSVKRQRLTQHEYIRQILIVLS